MLVFILFGVQYLHNDVFSFEIGLIHQKHSLNYHNLIKIPSSKIPLFLSLLSIWKTLIHFRVFIVSTIYINNNMFEANLFLLYTNYSCLFYQHTMPKKLVENLTKKL